MEYFARTRDKQLQEDQNAQYVINDSFTILALHVDDVLRAEQASEWPSGRRTFSRAASPCQTWTKPPHSQHDYLHNPRTRNADYHTIEACPEYPGEVIVRQNDCSTTGYGPELSEEHAEERLIGAQGYHAVGTIPCTGYPLGYRV